MSNPRHVVTFHFTLHDPENRLLDTSSGGEPITYLEGAGQIIDGLEQALTAVEAGAKTRIQVPAAQAYGEHDPAQVGKIPRDRLPVGGELKVGDQFQTGPDRGAPVVTVVSVTDDEVELDANHPLAGVDLTFDVEVVSKREATPTELEHGHVHAEGDSCG